MTTQQPWYADMLEKDITPCINCTVGTWGACFHSEYGKCKYADMKYSKTISHATT